MNYYFVTVGSTQTVTAASSLPVAVGRALKHEAGQRQKQKATSLESRAERDLEITVRKVGFAEVAREFPAFAAKCAKPTRGEVSG